LHLVANPTVTLCSRNNYRSDSPGLVRTSQNAYVDRATDDANPPEGAILVRVGQTGRGELRGVDVVISGIDVDQPRCACNPAAGGRRAQRALTAARR